MRHTLETTWGIPRRKEIFSCSDAPDCGFGGRWLPLGRSGAVAAARGTPSPAPGRVGMDWSLARPNRSGCCRPPSSPRCTRRDLERGLGQPTSSLSSMSSAGLGCKSSIALVSAVVSGFRRRRLRSESSCSFLAGVWGMPRLTWHLGSVRGGWARTRATPPASHADKGWSETARRVFGLQAPYGGSISVSWAGLLR